jgi:glycosyltransferase involved in cell wall biosynthesis
LNAESPAEPRSAVTAVVLTRDEEAHLGACLATLAWAHRLLVLDSGSTDATVQIASAMGAEVHPLEFENFSIHRQRGLSLVHTEWTLFVDADERVPEALAAEIAAAVRSDEFAGYWIARRNVFWGRTLAGGGWWPDWQLRLLRTAKAHYDPTRTVHEVAELDGIAGRLAEPLVHLNYDSWHEFRTKQRSYALLEARRRSLSRPAPRTRSFISLPLREVWRRFVALGGWRDGATGAALALAMAYYEGVTLLEQRRLHGRGQPRTR